MNPFGAFALAPLWRTSLIECLQAHRHLKGYNGGSKWRRRVGWHVHGFAWTCETLDDLPNTLTPLSRAHTGKLCAYPRKAVDMPSSLYSLNTFQGVIMSDN